MGIDSNANSKSEWSIRSATSRDTEQIVALLKVTLGEGIIPRAPEFWNWKHYQNPFGASPGLVAENEGKIIAIRFFMRWKWRSGNFDVPACRAVDTATHPQWRGKRIFSTLTQKLLEEIMREGAAFVFNTPNALSLPGYLKMGWKRVGRIPLWIKIRKPGRIFQALLHGRGINPNMAPEFESTDEMLRQDWLTEFLSKSTPVDRRYHTVRTFEYLQWRYKNIPGITYSAKWVFDEDQAAVLIFRNRLRRNLNELAICEMLLTQSANGNEIGEKLVRDAVRQTDADYVIGSAFAPTREQGVFRRAGFIPLYGLGPIFTVRFLNSSSPVADPTLPANWRCSIGDLEIF